jgi:hypothetical protein
MLTAPALAQGGAPQATTPGSANTASAVAKPTAKTHRAARITHKRVKHVRHIRHGKYATAHARKHVVHARHRASAKHARRLKATKQLAPIKSRAQAAVSTKSHVKSPTAN